MSNKRIASLFPPEQIVVFSLLGTIIVGTLMLMLPAARTTPIASLDLFFTATSATCISGLFTVPIDQFTLFGQSIILCMIQIGGLGIITLTLFFLSMFMNFGLGTQLMAGNILELDTWRQIKRTLLSIIMVTIICELIGTLLIFSVLKNYHTTNHAWFLSLFHAVSSFCSAGITCIKGGVASFKNSPLFLTTTMALMFVGELGFITWQEIGSFLRARYSKKQYRFSLHSKIILYGSAILLAATTILFWIIEHNNTLSNMPLYQSLFDSLFYAVSFKSTGFLLNPLGSFQLATILLIMIVSFIGSAPGSTGSGIKITTFVLFLATVKAAIIGKNTVTIQGRSIAIGQVYRAIGIISIGFGWIITTTFLLLITESGPTFLEILFESVTAFTSIGLSTGITPVLSVFGKVVIMISMVIGRIGSFTLILALKLRKPPEATFTYPEERVMLG